MSSIAIIVPSKEKLYAKRAIKEDKLDPEMDDWDGWLGKDNGGLFSFRSVDVMGSLQPKKGEKIYFKDHYERLENRMIELFREAKMMKDNASDPFSLVFGLMRLEAAILTLSYYHATPPTGKEVLSADELEEAIEHEAQSQYLEYYSNFNPKTMHSPFGLLNEMRRVLGDEGAAAEPFPFYISIETNSGTSKYLH